ncbi:MAG: AMP-binding protein [Afipia sp.]|nr:AMP-binding protein [Afipia sp.]
MTFREVQPEAFLSSLSTQNITHVLLTPVMINFLPAQPSNPELDFSSLKHMAYGGSPITEPVLQAAMNTLGCEFSQIYRLTEISGGVSSFTPDDHCRGAGFPRSYRRSFALLHQYLNLGQQHHDLLRSKCLFRHNQSSLSKLTFSQSLAKKSLVRSPHDAGSSISCCGCAKTAS